MQVKIVRIIQAASPNLDFYSLVLDINGVKATTSSESIGYWKTKFPTLTNGQILDLKESGREIVL